MATVPAPPIVRAAPTCSHELAPLDRLNIIIVLSSAIKSSVLTERRLADATLTAPNDGIILTRVHEPGAVVAAGESFCVIPPESVPAPQVTEQQLNDPRL